MYACLHNTCYDAQYESGRHYYLFEAIKLIGDPDYFKERITDRLHSTGKFDLTGHLCGLLYLFWKNGSGKAADSLQKKLDTLTARLPHITRYSSRSTPRENAEQAPVWLMDIYGIKSFFESAERFGTVLMRSRRKNVIWYDWFLSSAEHKFGKERIYSGLKKRSAGCAGIKRFLDEISLEAERKKEREKNCTNAQISVQDLIRAEQSSQTIRFYGFGRSIAASSSQQELKEIAAQIDASDDPGIRTALLNVFRRTDYLYPVQKLMSIYDEGNDMAKPAALEALARFRHPEIHKLAVFNLQEKKYIPESLMLLEKNFKNDCGIIFSVLKSHRDSEEYDSRSLTTGIRRIFSRRKISEAKEILLFDYHKNRCSACREEIAEIMCRSGCIPADIPEECLYDSSENTQRTAGRYKNKLLLTNP